MLRLVRLTLIYRKLNFKSINRLKDLTNITLAELARRMREDRVILRRQPRPR